MATTTRDRDIALHYRRDSRAAARRYTGLNAESIQEIRTEPSDLGRRIVDILADRQAEDTVLLDVGNVVSFADYFIIATSINARHMHALVETLEKELREDGVKAMHREGDEESGWVLIDYGSVIVHLFSAELRAFYALEELWQAAKQVVRVQ
jgi:ribosome-associated protein